MPGELADFGRRIEQITDPAALRRISAKGGKAAKEAVEKAASGDVGGDRKMSNLRRGGRLTATVREGQTTHVDLTPTGQWMLAQSGRRSSGKIRPKGRAVRTPHGPRASSSYGSSRGLSTVTDAMNAAGREVPKAAFQQFQIEVGKAAH